MSLDVYLIQAGPLEARPEGERIFIRRDGQTVEISRAEWDELQPGREPVAVLAPLSAEYVFEYNITHNLGRMANECGLYEPLWEAEDNGVQRAGDLIEPIEKGIAVMRSDRERLQKFNPENGWGDYDGLLRFAEAYLEACREYPDAKVHCSR